MTVRQYVDMRWISRRWIPYGLPLAAALVASCRGDVAGTGPESDFGPLFVVAPTTAPNAIEWSDELEAETSTTASLDLTPVHSRCPETVGLPGGERFISPERQLLFSVRNPDPPSSGVPGDFDLIYLSVTVSYLKFFEYTSRGFPQSNAIFRLGNEVVSNDAKWAAPVETAFSVACLLGFYAPDALGAITTLKWHGKLRIIDFPTEHLRRLCIEEDGDQPSQGDCDDPLTDEVEQAPCEAGPPQVVATGNRQVDGFSRPPGGGGWKRMCDVIFWYQSDYRGGPWRFMGTEVNWSSCSYEPID